MPRNSSTLVCLLVVHETGPLFSCVSGPWKKRSRSNHIIKFLLIYFLLTLRFIFQVICKYFLNSGVEDDVLLNNVFNAVSVFFNGTGQSKCLQLNENSPDSLLTAGGWGYQVIIIYLI